MRCCGRTRRRSTTRASTSSRTSRSRSGSPRPSPPYIVIASNGMLTGGRSVGHAERLLDDPSATVLFVGYQGEGTLGGHLVRGAKTARIAGHEMQVRATIRSLDGFSAHADEPELLAWLRRLHRRPARRRPGRAARRVPGPRRPAGAGGAGARRSTRSGSTPRSPPGTRRCRWTEAAPTGAGTSCVPTHGFASTADAMSRLLRQVDDTFGHGSAPELAIACLRGMHATTDATRILRAGARRPGWLTAGVTPLRSRRPLEVARPWPSRFPRPERPPRSRPTRSRGSAPRSAAPGCCPARPTTTTTSSRGRPRRSSSATGSRSAARRSSPQPGSFLVRDVLGESVLLVRGRDDEIRAFYNVCRHRGTAVEERECGTAVRFQCPYHAWIYDLDGKPRAGQAHRRPRRLQPRHLRPRPHPLPRPGRASCSCASPTSR